MKKSLNQKLAETMKEIRKGSSIPYKDYLKKTKFESATVTRLENGSIPIKPDRIEIFCRVVGIKPFDFFKKALGGKDETT